MLKKLTLKNFVHFPDKHSFEFDEGSYFFIGENRSGKSCAFEAIRRCMSTSKNVFLSSSHDKTQPSVVVCEYKADERRNEFVSCYARFPNESGMYGNDVVVKLVSGKSRDSKVLVDLVKKIKHDLPVKKAFSVTDEANVRIHKDLYEGAFSTDTVENCIRNFIIDTQSFKEFQQGGHDVLYDDDTDCERFLKENIDAQVVMTDPMRSTCPVQWTNSKKLTRGKEDVNFLNEMRDNSEILAWYLDSVKDVSDEERETERRYFDILTEGSRIRFEKKDDMIEVVDNGNIVSLEKAPEGIFEAKICAILLSIKQFKTICLEETGRGMHTQMIERLRDLILKKIRYKTVIIISHIPTFLTPSNIDHIFFFRKHQAPDKLGTFNVVEGKTLLKLDNKTRRMISNYSLATIFFARRVLLIEGESEQIFMSRMKSLLLDDDTLAENVITHVVGEPSITLDALRRFLSSLHILPLNGEPNKLRLEEVCKALGLERYFVLDYDAILEHDQKVNKHTTDKFFETFKLMHLHDRFKSEGVQVLVEKGIFVWRLPPDYEFQEKTNRKVGTIEHALITLTEIDGRDLSGRDLSGRDLSGRDLKAIFDHNNSTLKWCHTTKMKNRHKLFSSQYLTEDNIHNVVDAVIKCCIKHPESDVFRMFNFILNAVRVSEVGNF